MKLGHLEYFFNKGDDLWNHNDDEMMKLTVAEMIKINSLERGAVLDASVIDVSKNLPPSWKAACQEH